MDANALIRKARRAAKSLQHGDLLMSALTSAPYFNRMKEAVEEEVPPVSKISDLLEEGLGDQVDFTTLPVRQFIGMAVKAIMATEGYEVMETGVKIAGNNIFRSGATYQLIQEDPEDDLLSRFVAALNPDELERLQELVEAAL